MTTAVEVVCSDAACGYEAAVSVGDHATPERRLPDACRRCGSALTSPGGGGA